MSVALSSPPRLLGKTARAPDFSAPGDAREFLGNRFVYAVVSRRARGLSVGVNINPDGRCNFNCAYCEVNRAIPALEKSLDVDVMAEELQRTLMLAASGALGNIDCYRHTPAGLLQLRQVALSGSGEPTLCPNFLEAVRGVVHVRARGQFPFFKIVLFTNASRLDLREVKDGLKLFTPQDEIWAKLDAGTQDRMAEVNRPDCPLEKILGNILLVARQRPVVIQSFFPLLHGQEPSSEEIFQYAQRLYDLKRAGAQISLVQIYSATRPAAQAGCGHLPLKTLTRIAQVIRDFSGLMAEVF
jgi:wyosine [tRNA(Phe)-imidazoG37] synthetase (radical SAM superfamily)